MQTQNRLIRLRRLRHIQPRHRDPHPMILLNPRVRHPRRNVNLGHRIRLLESTRLDLRHDGLDIIERRARRDRIRGADVGASSRAASPAARALGARLLALLAASLLVDAFAEPAVHGTRDEGRNSAAVAGAGTGGVGGHEELSPR